MDGQPSSRPCLDDVLAALLKDGRIFAARFHGEHEERYIAAEYFRETMRDPRVDKVFVAPSLMRQHPDLFEVVPG